MVRNSLTVVWNWKSRLATLVFKLSREHCVVIQVFHTIQFSVQLFWTQGSSYRRATLSWLSWLVLLLCELPMLLAATCGCHALYTSIKMWFECKMEQWLLSLACHYGYTNFVTDVAFQCSNWQDAAFSNTMVARTWQLALKKKVVHCMMSNCSQSCICNFSYCRCYIIRIIISE